MPVLFFLLYMVAEVAVLIWVGGAIGVLPTIGLLVVGTVLGGVLLRREGRRTMHALQASRVQQTSPADGLADGALLGVGAFLVFLPGLVSDLLGILLILPPTRALLRPVIKASVARRVQVVGTGMWTRTRAGRSTVIEGEVIDPDVVGDRPPSSGRRPLAQ